MRAAGIFLFVLACGDPGPAPGETALVLTVRYDDSNIDRWNITGVALVSGRSFGPYDAHGDQVRSGESIGLIFDPSDAGNAMVCVEGRDGSTPRANACGMFSVKANQVSQGTLDLQPTH